MAAGYASRSTKINKADKNGIIAYFPPSYTHLYPGIQVTGHLIDLQSRFNLNNLQNPEYKANFAEILKEVLPEATEKDRNQIMNATIEWISSPNPQKGVDPFEGEYLKRKPPYLQSHQFMRHKSEFRLVSGVTKPIYQKLLPYISTLPEETPMNINTASTVLLKSLSHGLSPNELSQILNFRGLSDENQSNTLMTILEKLDIPPEQIAQDSSYFFCVAKSEDKNASLILYSLIKRNDNAKRRYQTYLIQQSMNTE